MFTKKPPSDPTGLEKAIDQVLLDMHGLMSDSKEYAAMATQLQKLYNLKALDKPSRVSPDTLAIIAGNLAGILVIVVYERTHVVTSKALSFILKLR